MSEKDIKRALMIARKQHALLARVANIYAGPGGGAYPGPGGGGYAGPGGGKYTGPSRYAKGGKIPPFKLDNGAAKVIETKGQPKATPQQYAALPGIKPDEIKYGNLNDLPAKSMPREEVIKHLEANKVPLEETVYKGDDPRSALARYGHAEKLVLPGGQNHREVLLSAPGIKGAAKSGHIVFPSEDAMDDFLHSVDAEGLGDRDYGSLDRGADNHEHVVSFDNLNGADHAVFHRLAGEHGGNISVEGEAADAVPAYRSSHWPDQPNVLAHVRLSDRRGPNGEKILHVEEIQSDWGQQGREEGFANSEERKQKLENAREKMNAAKNALDLHVENVRARVQEKYAARLGNMDPTAKRDLINAATKDVSQYHLAMTPEEKETYERLHGEHNDAYMVFRRTEDAGRGVPPGPYVDNTQKWTDLALKRILHEAAHGNYDKVVFTPGDEHNKRYSLVQKVDALHYDPVANKLLFKPKREMYPQTVDAKPDELPSQIGKELTEKLLKAPLSPHPTNPQAPPIHTLSGEDMEVGGGGMRGYYDNIMPKRLNALVKQHDPQARVQLHAHPVSTQDELVDMAQAQWAREAGEPPPAPSEAPLHSLDITPQLRDSIKANGFNQFKRGGYVERATGGRVGYADGGGTDHPAWIPTRLVTSKKHVAVPGERNIVDLASLRQTPDVYRHNVDLVRAYPNMPRNIASLKSHDRVSEAFIEHVKDNLLALHDAVPEHIRGRSKRWYDGARAITDRWMQKYNLPDHSIAGALAALSPQKDWYQNVSLAERVLDAMRGGDNIYASHPFDEKMARTFAARPSLNKPAYEGVRQLLNGRTLSDLDGLALSPEAKAQAKALWIRMHDEAYNDPAHPIVTPEGDFGEFVKTAKGARAKVGWGSLGEIGKAVLAIENANNPEALSGLMGEKHKVRNFYNNILVPRSQHGDVTIDTHAVAAGLLRPLSGNSLEVAHNFANYPGKDLPTARGTALTGIQGTYPLYAEAYRRAAAERGILPREMQSITWEAVRGLFPDTAKTVAHNNRVNEIWNQHKAGRISQDEARQRIFNLTAPNGIPAPSWFVEGSAGANEGNGSAAGQGALPQLAVRGAPAGTPDGRARGGSAPAVSPRPSRSPTSSVIDRALALVSRL